MSDRKFTDEEIAKALELCSPIDPNCNECPIGGVDCRKLEELALSLIKKQKEQLDFEKGMRKLAEFDVADRDKMLKQKVEVVYEDFMKDYNCIKEENDGLYKELAEQRAEIERLKKALISVNYIAKRIPQTICDHCVPDFNRNGLPVNVWKAKEGYTAIDALVDQIAKEAMA